MRIISHSVSDTLKIGRIVAGRLKQGDIICLFGQLGSGKTTLVKGIAQGLGVKKNKIISPSFVIIRQYTQAKPPLYHFDLYRLKGCQDMFFLGYEEYLYGDGIAVIEWAERLGYLLPEGFLKIKLSVKSSTERLFEFSANKPRYKKLLESISAGIRRDYSV